MSEKSEVLFQWPYNSRTTADLCLERWSSVYSLQTLITFVLQGWLGEANASRELCSNSGAVCAVSCSSWRYKNGDSARGAVRLYLQRICFIAGLCLCCPQMNEGNWSCCHRPGCASTGCTCECLAAGGAGSRKAGLCQGWAREKGASATGVLHLKQN